MSLFGRRKPAPVNPITPEDAEEHRKERGLMASAVADLSVERHRLEELMDAMIAETKKGRHA